MQTWFLEGMKSSREKNPVKAAWYNVMCLTGLDYFGSLGYAPGIAALAAGILAPSATLVLIILTLFGALPMYKRVAEQSPHGQGSISMLKDLVPGWGGKAIVLILLGFAATDFVITITLSAADAAQHIIKNNYVQDWCHLHHNFMFMQNQEGITFVLLSILACLFLLGFKEAIQLAVVVVWSYIILNVGVTIAGAYQVFSHPAVIGDWQSHLLQAYKTPWHITTQSLILFPQLALGMSGFETGVAVMPLVRGDATDSEEQPRGRIRNTYKLLTTAAIIMSIFLLASSIITTLLIPQAYFAEGGAANGRALAYLAHTYLGPVYGSFYDVSTIFILWFSGASSLAGLLSLVPQYLPRFGMAPAWARATRPLVVFFAIVSFVVTYLFKANVDAQGGAYATGVLVLMSSAAFAVFMIIPKQQMRTKVFYAFVSLVFFYTTIMNIIQRPEGLHIAAFFILTIFVISFISRVLRATELRTKKVFFDEGALITIKSMNASTMHIVAHRPGQHDYALKAEEARQRHFIKDGLIVFLEVTVANASDFSEDEIQVHSYEEDGYDVWRTTSVSAPNAIASILLSLRHRLGCNPHAYMYWTEGNPLFYVLQYLFLGTGETASITREILREVEKDPKQRPLIHVV